MKIDFDQQLKKIDGTPLFESEVIDNKVVETSEAVTLKRVCTNALLSQHRQEQNVTGEDSFKRHQLALRVNNEKLPELKTEEIVLIKKLLGYLYAPLVVGGSYQLLEGK